MAPSLASTSPRPVFDPEAQTRRELGPKAQGDPEFIERVEGAGLRVSLSRTLSESRTVATILTTHIKWKEKSIECWFSQRSVYRAPG